MADVIEASQAQLVLLDLWAHGVGRSRRRFWKTGESNGRCACKMNIDEHPAVAQHYGAIHTGRVCFKNGQPERFMGALPKAN